MDLRAPAPDQFPTFPASWYLFGPVRELRRGPVSKTLLGRRLVAFRTSSGKLVVLDGRCTHMGADLGNGCVVGEEIQCPYHSWRFTPDGRCSATPYTEPPPRSHLLRSYPVVERGGLLFFFNGERPLFPLPFFPDADPAQFVAARPLRYDADGPWYMVMANSFDVQHFHGVHARELVGEPVIDCPHEWARRIRVTFRVAGNSVADRLLRWFVGEYVQVSMTNWGGPVIVVTADFRRTRSWLTIFTDPVDRDRCYLNILPHVKRGSLGPLFRALSLLVRRQFTHHFIADEIRTLAGIRYLPEGLAPADRPMIEFFRWLVQLPQHQYAGDRANSPLSYPSSPSCLMENAS
jgi:nitrite reductase/ring-hydroxylating ferredoxin subunit